jgi:phosphotransferase system IIA component
MIQEENMDSGLLYVVYNEWIRDPDTNEMPYKIGITKNSVDDRYYGLGLKMPGEFKTVFAYKFSDNRSIEQLVHGMLNQLCVNGEWFNVNKTALDSIQQSCKLMGGELVTEKIEDEIEIETESKDFTQYRFNGEEYGKNRLVLAVIKEYIKNNDTISLNDLQNVFEKKIQGSLGVIDEYNNAEDIYKRTGIKRHFVDDAIDLNNGQKIVVCSQWGIGNIDKFINKAKELGYNIEVKNNGVRANET